MADPLGGPVGGPLIGLVPAYARPTDPMAPLRDMMATMALMPALAPHAVGVDATGELPHEISDVGPLLPHGIPNNLHAGQVLAGLQQWNSGPSAQPSITAPPPNLVPLDVAHAELASHSHVAQELHVPPPLDEALRSGRIEGAIHRTVQLRENSMEPEWAASICTPMDLRATGHSDRRWVSAAGKLLGSSSGRFTLESDLRKSMDLTYSQVGMVNTLAQRVPLPASLRVPLNPILMNLRIQPCNHPCGCLLNVIGPDMYKHKVNGCEVTYWRLTWVFEHCVVVQTYTSDGQVTSATGLPVILDPGPPPIISFVFPPNNVALLGFCTTPLPFGMTWRTPVMLVTVPDLMLVPDCKDLRFVQVKKYRKVYQFCPGHGPDPQPQDDRKWTADPDGQTSYPGIKSGGKTIGLSDFPGPVLSESAAAENFLGLTPLKRYILLLSLRTYIYCDGKFRGIRKRRKRTTWTFDCTPENLQVGLPEEIEDEGGFVGPTGGGWRNDEESAASKKGSLGPMFEAYSDPDEGPVYLPQKPPPE